MSKDSQIHGLTETLKAANAYIESLESLADGSITWERANNDQKIEWRKRKSRYQWLREQAMPEEAE